MKKIFCLAFVLLSTIGIFAQERIIEKTEFDAVMKFRLVKFVNQAHRETVIIEHLSNEAVKNKTVSKTVFEFAAPRGNRSVYEFDSPTLKSRQEIITIDGKIYTRKDGGEWTANDLDRRQPEKPAREAEFKAVEERIEYKSLGTQLLGDLKASVYEKIERYKKVKSSDGKEMFSTIATKYWLDEDGGIIKEEALTENVFKTERNPSGATFRSLRTSVWEFDPKIKIEAPVTGK